MSVVRRSRFRPYGILALSLLLPGSGHVALGIPQRGLMFVFFTVLLGWVSFHLTTPAQSWFGRYAGGIFIYGVSVLDAYKIARLRHARSDATPGQEGAEA